MPACYTLLVKYTALVRDLEGFCVEYAGMSQVCDPVLPRAAHALTAELLDLITLMPDHQAQEIVDYITSLQAARALRARDEDEP